MEMLVSLDEVVDDEVDVIQIPELLDEHDVVDNDVMVEADISMHEDDEVELELFDEMLLKDVDDVVEMEFRQIYLEITYIMLDEDEVDD